MGVVRDWIKSRKMKDPVRGTLQVTACSRPPHGAMSGNFALTGIVTADGITPTAVEHSGVARVRKWPWPGQLLPITVDRADSSRLRIEWSDVEDSATVARRTAEELARARRHDPSASAPTAQAAPPGTNFTHTVSQSTTIDASGVPGLREEIQRITKSTAPDQALMQQLIQAKLVERGVLTPDGSPGPAASIVTGPASQPSGERVDPAERLRKLDKLRSEGLISDTEYQRLRLQILTEL